MNPGPGTLFAIARAEKVADHCCRKCGFHRDIEAHHLVHRAKIGGKHPLVHSIDNLIPLCHGCHQAHHTTAHGRVQRRFLTEAEITFIRLYSSPRWLDLWYPIEGAEEL